MTNKIIFEDEICLWWDRLTQLPEKGKYAVFLDDVLQGTTPTTHFEMYNVLPKTNYLVRLEMWDEADNSLCVLDIPSEIINVELSVTSLASTLIVPDVPTLCI